jgi:hypothetical protein
LTVLVVYGLLAPNENSVLIIIIIIINAVHTDRNVTANRPDIIIKNKEEKTCTLIDVTIPAGRNVQKEAEKKLSIKF